MNIQSIRSALPWLQAAVVITFATWAGATVAVEAAPTRTALNTSNLFPEVRDLKFRDFFQLPIGDRGLELSEPLRAAAGHRVRITGYMVAQEDAAKGRFFLTPMPLRMSEHADGDADDLPATTVVVMMPDGDRIRSIPHRPGLMQLTGVLQVGRQELNDGRVSWLRLLLDPPLSTTATQ